MTALVTPTPGTGTGDLTYIHTQNAAALVWTVHHQLNKRVAVSVVDSGDNQVYADVIYIDDNTVEVHLTALSTGKAYCN